MFTWFRRLTRPQAQTVRNPLAGKPLRYLIGGDRDYIILGNDAATVLPFDYDKPIHDPWAIGYGNLFWQRGAPDCAPYLDGTDTSDAYDERVIDPRGVGWEKNLHWQFARWKKFGANYIELDNPDAYSIADVLGAVTMAGVYGLKVIAKNPGLLSENAAGYMLNPNIYGAIVEYGAGSVPYMADLRAGVGKPDMPIWFVAFGKGEPWAREVAAIIKYKNYHNMGVTYSRVGEYGSSEDILRPQS